MGLFQKRERKVPIPEECKNYKIEVDKSICTGEMTVGFRNPKTRKLMYAELVCSEAEIDAYRKKYGK